jgi:hypothetical protein
MSPRWRPALTKWLWKLVILLEGVELESNILQFDTHNHSNLHAILLDWPPPDRPGIGRKSRQFLPAELCLPPSQLERE